MKSANDILNASTTKMNSDGRFTVCFGSKEACGDFPNRLDVSEGWNFLMRVDRPGPSVLNGSYKLPDAVPGYSSDWLMARRDPVGAVSVTISFA